MRYASRFGKALIGTSPNNLLLSLNVAGDAGEVVRLFEVLSLLVVSVTRSKQIVRSRLWPFKLASELLQRYAAWSVIGFSMIDSPVCMCAYFELKLIQSRVHLVI